MASAQRDEMAQSALTGLCSTTTSHEPWTPLADRAALPSCVLLVVVRNGGCLPCRTSSCVVCCCAACGCVQASSSVARLLSQAAAHMQEARSVAGGALDTQLALSFCKAVQVGSYCYSILQLCPCQLRKQSLVRNDGSARQTLHDAGTALTLQAWLCTARVHVLLP